MKHYQLSVSADSSSILNIDNVYQAEKKLLVFASISASGFSLFEQTWFSVGGTIDAPEDLDIECYLISEAHSKKGQNSYIPITKEEASKLAQGLKPVTFTQTKLDPEKVEYVIEYEKLQNKIHTKFHEVMELIKQYAEQRQVEITAQGKGLEPLDAWTIRFGHSPKVSARINELAEQNLLEDKAELQKLIEECKLDINKLILPKKTWAEVMQKGTGFSLSRHGLYAAAAGIVSVAAVSLTLMRKSQP